MEPDNTLFTKDFTEIVDSVFGKKKEAPDPQVEQRLAEQQEQYAIDIAVEEIDLARQEFSIFKEQIKDYLVAEDMIEQLDFLDGGLEKLRRALLWQFDPTKVIQKNGAEGYRRLLEMRKRWVTRYAEAYRPQSNDEEDTGYQED